MNEDKFIWMTEDLIGMEAEKPKNEKPKIKIELYRYKSVLFGSVLEIDESVRKFGDLILHDDFAIVCAHNTTALLSTRLYLRKDFDSPNNEVFSMQCFDEDEAIDIAKRIKSAVRHLNCTGKGSKSKSPIDTSIDNESVWELDKLKDETPKKQKLTIELRTCGNVLVGKVLHMDESFRGRGIIHAIGDFSIKSAEYPDLTSDVLFIRGNQKNRDYIWFTCAFLTPDEADETADIIRRCVDAINSKTEPKPEGTTDTHKIEKMM